MVHRNLSVADQVAEVDKVKRSESGMIVDPVTLGPDAVVGDAQEIMARYKISGVPIAGPDGRLVGILTNRDLRFHDDPTTRIGDVMTSEGLVTAPVGTTLEEAREILGRHRIEKLPVVDDDGRLTGLITVKDIQKRIQYPDSTKDEQGRLRVAAAVGTGPDAFERAGALVDVGLDVLVVDTAHGHSAGVIDTVRKIIEEFPVPVIAGNVATTEGGQGAARRRRQGRQGRGGPRLDLHHPGGCRRRRPAADRHPRLRHGGRGLRRHDHRRRWHPALR